MSSVEGACPPDTNVSPPAYPQLGQPQKNKRLSPTNPQEGQRTEEKNLPQCGHTFASQRTSLRQFSQKNRACFTYYLGMSRAKSVLK